MTTTTLFWLCGWLCALWRLWTDPPFFLFATIPNGVKCEKAIKKGCLITYLPVLYLSNRKIAPGKDKWSRTSLYGLPNSIVDIPTLCVTASVTYFLSRSIVTYECKCRRMSLCKYVIRLYDIYYLRDRSGCRTYCDNNNDSNNNSRIYVHINNVAKNIFSEREVYSIKKKKVICNIINNMR